MKPVVYWILGFIVYALLVADRVSSEELSADDVPEYRFDTVGEVSDVMRELLSTAPRRPLYRDDALRREYASEFVESGERYDVPEILVAVQFFNESSFRVDAVATDRPTVGLGQIHLEGFASSGCDLTTRRGQVDCSVRFMRYCFDHCRRLDPSSDWSSALIAYATRGHCISTNVRTLRSASRRVRQWSRFEEIRERIRDEIISDLEFYRDGLRVEERSE